VRSALVGLSRQNDVQVLLRSRVRCNQQGWRGDRCQLHRIEQKGARRHHQKWRAAVDLVRGRFIAKTDQFVPKMSFLNFRKDKDTCTIMSNQLLHDKFIAIQSECRLPPLLPLHLTGNRTPTYTYPPTPV